jgi:hypothetical protein
LKVLEDPFTTATLDGKIFNHSMDCCCAMT